MTSLIIPKKEYPDLKSMKDFEHPKPLFRRLGEALSDIAEVFKKAFEK
jgi:hypothetical protein